MADIPVIHIEEFDEAADINNESGKGNDGVTIRVDQKPNRRKVNDAISEETINGYRARLELATGSNSLKNKNGTKPELAERFRRSLIPNESKSSDKRLGSPGANRRNSVAIGNILKKFGKKESAEDRPKKLSLDSLIPRKPKLTDLIRKRYSIKPDPEVAPAVLLNALSIVRQRSARPRTPRKPKVPPLTRFRGYIRLSLICIRLCKYSYQNVAASQNEYLSIIQVTEDYVTETTGTEGLYFDPTVFVADKEQRLPVDARRILQKDARLRTAKDIEYLQIVLRSIKAFADYPNIMQKKLCKDGWYESYESKRAIVRQGAPPHAFYFILSGSVVVTSFGQSGTTFLVSLNRGMSFGELAVITRSKRQATVSTSNPTEFLCISAKDFVEIFMSGGIKSVTDPEHNSFIRSIPFLKHWPIECLASHPQACMFHFFGRGQVLVRDSNHSDWIYIVKSGSLSVMKKLVEVHPRTNQPRRDVDSEEDGEWGEASPKFKNFGTWNYRLNKKTRIDSSEEKEVFKNNLEMEKRLEQILPGYYNGTDRLGLIDYDEIITDHKTRILPSNRKTSTAESLTTLPTITINTTDAPPDDTKKDDDSVMDPAEEERAMKLPKIRKTSKRVIWKEPEVGSVLTMSPENKFVKNPVLKFPKGAYLASVKNLKRKVTRKEAIQEEVFQKQLEYDKKAQDTRKIGRKTIADELDNKLIKGLDLTEKDIRPMFVCVQVLERGQYFGLTKTVFPEQAESFSVVSNGAECIMISKRFFFEKANESTMYHLRQVETLLPQEEELQGNLQDFVDWKAHRARVYNRLVKNKQSRAVRHQQFPPQYGGQYCFRTGPTVRSID